jgi:hypothetical protein
VCALAWHELLADLSCFPLPPVTRPQHVQQHARCLSPEPAAAAQRMLRQPTLLQRMRRAEVAVARERDIAVAWQRPGRWAWASAALAAVALLWLQAVLLDAVAAWASAALAAVALLRLQAVLVDTVAQLVEVALAWAAAEPAGLLQHVQAVEPAGPLQHVQAAAAEVVGRSVAQPVLAPVLHAICTWARFGYRRYALSAACRKCTAHAHTLNGSSPSGAPFSAVRMCCKRRSDRSVANWRCAVQYTVAAEA